MALWVVAAWLLLRTRVPDLRLPHVPARDVLPAAELRRARRHDRFLAVDYPLALAAQLGGLALVAWQAPALERRLRGGAVIRTVQLGLAALAAGWLARLPFGLAAHWWERRYGLSPQGYGPWLLARLPAPGYLAVVLALLVGALLLARRLGRRWWLAAAPLLTVTAVVGALVQPLGMTLHPLRDRALVADARALARREGVSGAKLGVERVRKQTRTANAEAVGIGPTRRIVLWDTQLGFPRRQLDVLLAHELAHHARHHIWKGLAWFGLFSLPIAWLLQRAAARRGGLGEPAALPTALAVAAALQLLSLPLVSALSRRYEAEADWIAVSTTRDPAAARGLFADFARVNLEDPSPPPWEYVLLGDHPTLAQRVAMAEAWARRR